MKNPSCFLKKLLTIFCCSIFTFALAKPTTDFTQLKTLSEITTAFFAQPEYAKRFTTDPHNKPYKDQSGNLNLTLLEEVKAFGKEFSQDADKNKNFFNKSKWHKQQCVSKDERYAQKITLDTNATVCFMGDIHGSIHSLMRNIWRLVALNYLNKDLTINKPDFYMVFLGDFINYGRWSTEVFSMLMKLKLKNWDHVILLAGNHEVEEKAAQNNGFLEELQTKFGKQNGLELLREIQTNVFNNLPVALFITSNKTHVQCCHGGIEPTYKPKTFIKNKQAIYQNIGAQNTCRGLYWNSFCTDTQGEIRIFDGFCNVTDRAFTKKYLRKNNLKAIIRGHHDTGFGLKTFKKFTLVDDNNWPNHWRKSLPTASEKNSFFLAQFDHYPVFTFTTAAEGKELPYDCFGLVTTNQSWKHWSLKVHEYLLPEHHGQFVHVQKSKDNVDPIITMWHKRFNKNKTIEGLNTF